MADGISIPSAALESIGTMRVKLGAMTDIDAPFEQDIVDLPQRKRIANIHYDRQADHLG